MRKEHCMRSREPPIGRVTPSRVSLDLCLKDRRQSLGAERQYSPWSSAGYGWYSGASAVGHHKGWEVGLVVFLALSCGIFRRTRNRECSRLGTPRGWLDDAL